MNDEFKRMLVDALEDCVEAIDDNGGGREMLSSQKAISARQKAFAAAEFLKSLPSSQDKLRDEVIHTLNQCEIALHDTPCCELREQVESLVVKLEGMSCLNNHQNPARTPASMAAATSPHLSTWLSRWWPGGQDKTT